MPATPRASRRRSATPPETPSPLKPRRNTNATTSSVQDRIREWQAQSTANALDPDATSLRSAPLSDAGNGRTSVVSPVPVSPVTPQAQSRQQQRQQQRTVTGGRGRLSEQGKSERDDDRGRSTSSAPRKRLVSDQHWRANRDAGEPASASRTLKDSITTPHYDLSYTSNQRREERIARREKRRQSRLERQSQLLDEGRSDAKKHDSPPATVGELNSYIDRELSQTLDHQRATTPPLEENGPEQGSLNLPRTRPKCADSADQPDYANPGLTKSKSKSKGAAVFFKTKEIFGRYEKPIAQRGPSIEAWLEQQPDPFVENEAVQDTPSPEAGTGTETETAAVAVAATEARGRPSGHRRRVRRRESSSRETPDPNAIWDSFSTAACDQTPAVNPRETSWTYGDESLAQTPSPRLGQPEASPSTLRRGGRARRPRHKASDSHASPTTNPSAFQPEPLSSSPQSQKQQPDRLCPPTGTYQLSTIPSVETLQDSRNPLPPTPPDIPDIPPPDGEPSLKRKLTTHEDLMSVLSLPMQRKSTRSRRRAQQQQQQPSRSAEDLLAHLATEEEKYGKELRTLVDGVIPVLLQCVLSKSDLHAASGLFLSNADNKDDVGFTKPIIDMGIALERLRSLHSRIPTHSVDALLGWAHTAQKSYRAYLTAWRLGFQDVVVNLEPLENGKEVEQGMSRDDDGDVVDAAGKKADVAYLLKRPLVRVKNLSKTFESIKEISDRPLAAEVATTFADLTALARKRHQEEQGRLEDEAAARIDSTRARDVRTLAATSKASINPSRRVRARDGFGLSMYHSTGQQLDCHIEMIIRDNAPGSPAGGDVLICEVDDSGTWLLFPPIELGSISARRAEDQSDLVVMIRGPSCLGKEWHELLALTADDPETVTEWMSMFGSSPLPPKLNRTKTFKEPEKSLPRPLDADNKASSSSAQQQPPTPPPPPAMSVSEIDIPLGEPSIIGMKEAERVQKTGRSNNPFERFMGLNLGGGLQPKSQPAWKQERVQEKATPAKRGPSGVASDRSTISDQSIKEMAKNVKASSAPNTPRPNAGTSSRSPKDRRRLSKDESPYMMSGALSVQDWPPQHSSDGKAAKDSNVELKNIQLPHRRRPSNTVKEVNSAPTTPTVQKPELLAAAAAAAVTDAATSAALPAETGRRHGANQEPNDKSTPLNSIIQQQWTALSSAGKLRRRRKHHSISGSQIYTEDIPLPPPQAGAQVAVPPSAALQPQQPTPTKEPVTPERQTQQSTVPSSLSAPQLTPTSLSKDERARNRRSSSPLKHEYAPSTASESASDSDSDDDNDDSSSDTSDGFMSEVKDVAMPLVAVTAAGNRRSSKFGLQPPPSAPTTGTRTLAPSDSASQGPYRKVPASSSVPSAQKAKTIAMVCSWSNKGIWEQIHPDECSIVISPGLIEAFEMSSDHSNSEAKRDPLVAFELTPIVPLRRGTALDISIRSPPTATSQLKTTNNIMFRSRNADECDALYSAINWARCNNPTYIQLQRARPPEAPVSFNTGRGGHKKSWLGLGGRIDRRSSYRASAHPGAGAGAGRPPSATGDSEASAGGLSSAFSALKRFGVSSAFNLNRSSVTWQAGRSRASASLYSSESGTLAGSGSGTSTPLPSQLGLIPGKDGPNVPETSAEAANGGGMVNNMKIRLYVRKGQHWENLGAGRLTVTHAEDPKIRPGTSGGDSTPVAGGSGASPSRPPASRVPSASDATPLRGPQLASASHTPNRLHGHGKEKRIIVRKAKDEKKVLLDVTLGESCFERVMQTGIAVKVWDEDETIADKGGVVMGRGRVYMMQFPGMREAGWVFGLCGTYRYGTE